MRVDPYRAVALLLCLASAAISVGVIVWLIA